ncbi:radical SAM protein [Paenibacillus solani]|uniref:radical SAM protein n=1 Tax=Paenibacillus solani TaxID=1705565 RepID=UPI003D2CB44A
MTILIEQPINSLRLKVTDRCPWNCWWCHNEGTGERDPKVVGDVPWDEETKSVITELQNVLGFTEVHLTGGEPTAHPAIHEVIRGLTGMGLKVKATSIGNRKEIIEKVAGAGLQGFNFSLHSLEPELLHTTQVNRSYEWTKKQLEQQLRSIEYAKDFGVSVKVNTVIANPDDLPRARTVLQWAIQNNIPLRLMNELSSGQVAYDTIYSLLEEFNAIEDRRVHILGSSSHSTYYKLNHGYELAFKQIRDVYLDSMCDQCALKGDRCTEKYYGVRLERRVLNGIGKYYIRLCIHHSTEDTVMSVHDFLHSKQRQEIQMLMSKKVRDSVGCAE